MLQSGGAAFSSSNLVEAKPNQKRQFAQVTARKITEDLTNVELEKDCVCEQIHGLEYPRCTIMERKEKEQLAVNIYTSDYIIVVGNIKPNCEHYKLMPT